MEASPEQLSRCAAAAEQFTQQGGVRTRVIGWYHSHPHITVLPSHVDIKTQATYQMLDDGFVGLIFSTFNQASSRATLFLTRVRSCAGMVGSCYQQAGFPWLQVSGLINAILSAVCPGHLEHLEAPELTL